MSKVSEPMEMTDTSGFPRMKMLSIFLNLEKKKEENKQLIGRVTGVKHSPSVWSFKGKATEGNRRQHNPTKKIMQTAQVIGTCKRTQVPEVK